MHAEQRAGGGHARSSVRVLQAMDPPHVQALADDCHPQPHQHSPSHTCAHWSRRWRAAGTQRCSGERRCCREVSHAGSWACAFATHCLSSPAWREGGRTQGRRAEPQLAAGGCAQHAVGAAHCTPHCLAHAAPHCCCRNMKAQFASRHSTVTLSLWCEKAAVQLDSLCSKACSEPRYLAAPIWTTLWMV